jgi:hypothetical protein
MEKSGMCFSRGAQFKMVCERPPAAFGGSPPHEGENNLIAVGLFSFNGGVELGQLGFVCIVFPIVLYLSTSRWKPQFLSGSSAAIAALGFFWFIQRCFLAG